MRRYLWLLAMLIAALSLSSCARALVRQLVPAPVVRAEAAEITRPNAALYRITFVSDRDGAFAVYSVDLDGADLRRLTQEPGDAGEVSLSPDGSRLAFTAKRTGDSGTDLDVVVTALDGSGRHALAGEPGTWQMLPCWSPDGGSVALMSASGSRGAILVAGADGDALKQVSPGLYWDMQPAWSPDGRQLAFATLAHGRSEVYVVNADGSGLARLTELGARSEWPCWSPDGSRIAFVSNAGGATAIYTTYADGSGLRQLTKGDMDIEPCWSPDGTAIAFASSRDGAFAIYIADARTGAAHRLTAEPAGWQMQPTWSPDGAWVAFAAGSRGNWDVYVVRADGSDLRRLTTAPGYDLKPLWSPGQ